MGAFLAKREIPMRHFVVGILISTAALCACHEGDAVTDVRSPTPTPVAALQLSGTWTGHFGVSTETFTSTVTQNGTTVTADWIHSTYGAVRFAGELDRSHLRGRLTAQHDSTLCPIHMADLSGTANASRISVSGFTLCKSFDVFNVSVELTR